MYIYIIECEDGSLYTGIAKDIVHRLRQHYHHLPGCAKYTMSHQMKTLRALWSTDDKVTAFRLEFWIKKLTKRQKLELVASQEAITSVLPHAEGPLPEVRVVHDFDLSQVIQFANSQKKKIEQ